MIIRREKPSDIPLINQLNTLAFGRTAEAELVDLLRANGHVTLSLIAEEDQIVGHVLFSPVCIHTRGGPVRAQGLGPVAVRPEAQRRGIGSTLIRGGIELMRQAGHSILVVEGSPLYYSRFGFQDASLWGIRCEFSPPPGCFMVASLAPGALEGVQGVVHYSPEFQMVG
jgi:putative acetyltransferase